MEIALQSARVGNLLLNSILRCCRLVTLLSTAWAIFSVDAASEIDWPVLAFNEVVTNRFTSPTAIAHAGDGSGRLFVAQRDGRVWIIKNGKVLPEAFLDISATVTTKGPEQGLLGLAFPPNFAASQHFYAYYTMATNFPSQYDPPQSLVVISRFQVSFNPDRAPARTEEKLIVLQKREDYHNGGQLAFGPDGYLYIGIGDGGPHFDPENRAQNLKSLFGKILRIDVENAGSGYAIPPTNPFRGNTNALPEIWAYGLRNPWRFSFDRATGDLFIGDVGEGRYEEVDFQPAASAGGQNYGWRIMEGPGKSDVPAGFTNFPSLTAPILSYDHEPLGGDGGQGSVTGGYVSRGPNAGRLAGVYLYSDFMAGYIWGLRKVDGQWRTNALLTPVYGAVISISTFGEDEAGRLYMADYTRGIVYQITDSDKVWTPDFSPAPRSIPSDQLRITSQTPNSGIVVISPPPTFLPTDQLLITSLTPNAGILYTLDGSEPTASSPLVPADGRVTIPDGATVKARAFRRDLLPSEVRTATFKYRTGAPIFSPGPYATVLSNTLVTLRCETPDATIYVATNWYTGQLGDVYKGPLVVTNSMLLEARAVAPVFGTSEVVYAQIRLASVPPPVITPPGGYATNGTRISIACSNPDASLSYRIMKGNSISPSMPYTNALTLDGRMTVLATASLPGYAPGETDIQFFPATANPVFDPPWGTLFATQFTISCPTPGASISYIVNPYNGGVWKAYNGPVTITNGVYVSARAYTEELGSSQEQGSYYPWPHVDSPYFEQGWGPVTNGAAITISNYWTPPGLVIRYTLDGSTPDGNSPVYTGPVPISPPVTLKAAGEAPGYLPGYPQNVTSLSYGLADFERVFVTTYAGSTNAGSVDGPRDKARFWSPTGICIDASDNLYVLDAGNKLVRKITPEGNVTTIGSGFAEGAGGICLDPQGNVYVADTGNCNRILKFSLDSGATVFANVTACQPGYAWPFEISGMAYAGDASLFVGTVRTWNGPDRLMRVTATGFENITFVDSDLSAQTFPLAMNQGTNIYFGRGNGVFRMSSNGQPELFAGGTNFVTDGPISIAGFERPGCLATDGAGGFLVGDGTRLRRIRNGVVTTVAGTQVAYGGLNYRNGPGRVALLDPIGVCVDSHGIIYVADGNNNCIRKIEPDSRDVGLPDSWQLAYFAKTGIGPDEDRDGDGISNAAEYWAGTNPLDSGSSFAVNASPNANGALEINWSTVPAKRYQAQFSTDLIVWTNLGPEIAGTGSRASTLDSTAPYRNARWFYRVMITNN